MPRARPSARKAAPGGATAAAGEGRYPAGPLAVLDGAGTAHLSEGRTLSCRAGSAVELVEWALQARLGAERLHRHGQDADPLVVLTEAAACRFGLPPRLEDRRIDGGLRLADDHAVVREVPAAGWKLTRRSFGPWPRIYQPAEPGHRQRGGRTRPGPDPTDYASRLRNASSTAETCRNRPVRREGLRSIHQLRRRSATSELRKQVAELNATVRPVETARFRSSGDKPNRLGRCAATECDTTFADTSPTGRRRYCSQRCANRDAVCRHRARAAVI